MMRVATRPRNFMSPDAVDQFLPADDVARALGQCNQDVERPASFIVAGPVLTTPGITLPHARFMNQLD